MKKLAILSMVTAALLLSGCNKKEESSHTAMKSVSSSVHSVSSSVHSVRSTAIKEALPGAPLPAKEAVSSVASSLKAAQKNITDQVASKIEETKKSIAAKLPQKAAIDVKALFGKCAACHGPDGKRKALGKSAPIAGMPKDELLKKLEGYQAGTLNQYGMGALMKAQVAGLSKAQLEALAQYISSLK